MGDERIVIMGAWKPEGMSHHPNLGGPGFATSSSPSASEPLLRFACGASIRCHPEISSSPSNLQLLRPRPAGRPAAGPAPDRPRNRANQAGGARAADGRGREFAAGGVGSVSGRAAAEGGLGGARHGCARPRLVPTHAAILLSTRRLSCRPSQGRRSCQLCVTCTPIVSLRRTLDFPSKPWLL